MRFLLLWLGTGQWSRDHLPVSIKALDLGNVSVNGRVRVCQPTLLDWLLARIVGGCDKPQLSFKQANQV
ncbi:MAG TPA: hypothetical protein VMH85_02850, partial [Terriglobales bacterium]|nr:hypothetical protein [Terriglobales bacterium]